MALSDRILYEHLAGKRTIGVYPLMEDDTCHFLAVDFDEGDWREDAKAFCLSCEALKVPCPLEISRSGTATCPDRFIAEGLCDTGGTDRCRVSVKTLKACYYRWRREGIEGQQATSQRGIA